MRLCIVILSVILLISCKTDEQYNSIQVESEIDTTLARIGDVLNFNVRTHFADDKIVSFPDIPENESMEIRSKAVFVKDDQANSVNFEIVFWDTGSFVIPAYPVQILHADSTLDFSILTDSVNVNVISMLEGVEDTNLRPIKDPEPLREPINWRRWLLAFLLAFLVMILIGLWRRRIKKQPLEKISVSENQSAKDIAIARLDELKKIIKVDNKTFYLHLSFLIREFIENQYYLRALEMTTSEIREFENDMDLDKNNFKGILNLLNRADLAKFAKQEFAIAKRQSDYNWTSKFVMQFEEDTNN